MSTDYDILNVGLDWLTATTKEYYIGVRWWEIWNKHKEATAESALDVRDWRNRWYQGVTCNGLTWGHSDRLGYIMVATGGTAQSYGVGIVPKKGNVTRLDLQVTVRLVRPRQDVAKRSYSKVRNNKQRQYSIIQNSLDGQTLYVGSRHSDSFGRLYDKGVKSGEAEPGCVWRYEVELKKPRAMVVTESVLKSMVNGQVNARAIQGYIWVWFNNRGVRPMFNSDGGTLVSEVGATATTTGKKLNWLRTQVKPTVQKLIAEGLGRDVIDALGGELIVNQCALSSEFVYNDG